jgi:YHS domain-containing protein
MNQLDPKDGTEVEVTYAGMKKAKNGKSYHDFEVWIRG